MMADPERIIRAALKTASDINIIKRFGRVPRYNDEPQFYQYAAEFVVGSTSESTHTDISYGTSFETQTALLKALCEAIERHSLSAFEGKQVVATSKQLGNRAIDVTKLKYFSSMQLRQDAYSHFRFTQETLFQWIRGRDLLRNRDVLIPSQLALLPYRSPRERIIRFPDSTGAACEVSKNAAISRGIFEVFERDAYMCWFLTNSKATLINLKDSRNVHLRKIEEVFRRYLLELIVLKLPSNLPFPIIMAVVIDKTGIGPAVTVGLKAHYDLVEAVTGSVAEACQCRPWIRDLLSRRVSTQLLRPKKISTFGERALYWADVNKISKIVRLWQGAQERHVDQLSNSGFTVSDWAAALQEVLQMARRLSLDVYAVNVTPARVADHGFVVAKVIIPQAQPVYFNEAYPYLGSHCLQAACSRFGSRWKSKSKGRGSSLLPHPFL
jgi:ribosomal protein S12 methylthiotransferase accessory factor